jgi:hypothetical protein
MRSTFPSGRSASRLPTVPRCDPDIHDDSLTVLHDDDDLERYPGPDTERPRLPLSGYVRSMREVTRLALINSLRVIK